MRILYLLLAVAPLFAAEDANAILQQLLEARKTNGDRIAPYIYVEDAVHFTYTRNGRLHRNLTETREVIFVEGYPFHKLIARNGKPLPAKEQTEIRKAVDQTAAERRRQPRPPKNGQLVMGGQRIDLGTTQELLSLFDNRLTGEEEIRGRKAWLIESVPQPGHVPASEHERDVLSFRETLWIDQASHLPLREVYSVVDGAIGFAAPGSTIRVDYDEIAPEVWCQTDMTLDVWRPSGKEFKPWKRTEYTASNFRKFDVQSTVTVIGHAPPL